jgi:cell division topological specificity factor
VFNALKKRLFGNDSASKAVAKSRLHFVLVQDRTGLTNEEMAGFREEMVKVIEKYFVIDKEGFDIKYHRLADTTTLLINSPVIVRRAGAAPEPRPKPNLGDEPAAVASNI